MKTVRVRFKRKNRTQTLLLWLSNRKRENVYQTYYWSWEEKKKKARVLLTRHRTHYMRNNDVRLNEIAKKKKKRDDKSSDGSVRFIPPSRTRNKRRSNLRFCAPRAGTAIRHTKYRRGNSAFIRLVVAWKRVWRVRIIILIIISSVVAEKKVKFPKRE